MNENNLQHQLEQLSAAFPGRVFLHAHNLTTGDQIAIDDDIPSRCASEAKLFILLTYAEQVAAGQLDPGHRVTLATADQVPGSGVMRFATPGLQPTVSFLAYLMMTVSDNTTTNMLLDVVGGPTAVQATIDRLGIPDTTIHNKIWQPGGGWIESSARGLARAAELLDRPDHYHFPPAAAAICKTIMTHHYEDNGLARYLPWSPFAAEMIDGETDQQVIANYAGMQLYAKAGYTLAYRGDVALCVTPRSHYVLGLKCRDIPGAKPLNAANSGFTFSAELGRLLYESWG